MFGDEYSVIYIVNSLTDRKSHLLLPPFPKKIFSKYYKEKIASRNGRKKDNSKKLDTCFSKLNKISETIPMYLVKCLFKQPTCEIRRGIDL